MPQRALQRPESYREQTKTALRCGRVEVRGYFIACALVLFPVPRRIRGISDATTLAFRCLIANERYPERIGEKMHRSITDRPGGESIPSPFSRGY